MHTAAGTLLYLKITMQYISSLHKQPKEVSAVSLFKTGAGTVTAIQLQANATLKEHITHTPAFLLCVYGAIVYHNEYKNRYELAKKQTSAKQNQLKPIRIVFSP